MFKTIKEDFKKIMDDFLGLFQSNSKLLSRAWFRDIFNNLFSSKLSIAILSVFLAFILWIAVVGTHNGDMTKKLEVIPQYKNVPVELTLYPGQETVEVSVAGDRRSIDNLTAYDLQAEVDLRGMEKGKHRLPIELTPPNRIKIMNIQPNLIEVELVAIIDKKLPIVLEIEGGLPPGTTLSDTAVSPDVITARGREDVLSKINSAKALVTIDELRDQSTSSGVTVSLLKDPALNGLELDVKEVTVTAIISGSELKRSVPITLTRINSVPDHLTLKSALISPQNAIIEGDREKLDQIKSIPTQPLDLSSIRQSEILTLPLQLQDGIKITGNPEVTVDLTVALKKEKISIGGLPIRIRNSQESDQWQTIPSTASVTLDVPIGEVPHIDPSSIAVYVDVSNIFINNVRLPVRVETGIPDTDVLEVEPSAVSAVK